MFDIFFVFKNIFIKSGLSGAPTPPPQDYFLLKEDGGFLLKEDGGKIIL